MASLIKEKVVFIIHSRLPRLDVQVSSRPQNRSIVLFMRVVSIPPDAGDIATIQGQTSGAHISRDRSYAFMCNAEGNVRHVPVSQDDITATTAIPARLKAGRPENEASIYGH
ncbi:hypothetical protein OKW45_008059 [Paraburkholderia sp. WSM4175]|uniref:hypothetical protein n=1 Tax=Paraburkholderia sp. WSM4175 TaxID=2991072 RepID=UPI003D1DC2FC